MKDLLVVVCETSGAQIDVLSLFKRQIKGHKVQADYIKLKTPPEIATFLQKNKDHYKTVAVYGGDGSITAAIKSLTDSNIRLIILPGGTANTIAADLELPSSAEDILNMYLEGRYRTANYDVALAGKRKFVLDMHTGFWTRAIVTTPRGLKKRIGALAYGVSAIKQLPKAEKTIYKLTLDGRAKVVNSYMVLIANQGLQHMLGVKLFNHDHRSGVLQVAFVKSLNPWRLTLWLFGKLFLRRPLGGAIKTYRAHRLVLNESTTKFLFDDKEQRISLPLTILGSQFQTKIIVGAREVKTNTAKTALLYTRTLLIRFKERLRRFISGVPELESTQLAPRLFVGGAYRTEAYKNFENWNIKAIVNMRSTPSKAAPKGFDILHLKTKDWSAPDTELLKQGVEFIDKHVQNDKGVYVHCRQGEGRGPTMAAAYLIYKGMDVNAAVSHIKKSRPMSHPNRSQIKRLTEWQEYCAKNLVVGED